MAKKAYEEATKAHEEASLAHEEATKAHGESVKANETSQQAKEAAFRTQMVLENEISRKIDIIGEGHDFLKMRLSDAMKFELKSERMELDMMSLRIDVKKIKAHLNID